MSNPPIPPGPAHATFVPASPTPDPQAACLLMREVGVLAHTALRVCRDRPAVASAATACARTGQGGGTDASTDAEQDDDLCTDLRDRLLLVLQTLARIGWMADVAMRQLGDTGSFATAEDWMLPEG